MHGLSYCFITYAQNIQPNTVLEFIPRIKPEDFKLAMLGIVHVIK